MERLTTNKPVDEMSMLELAHNSCYAEDGKARYRDFEMNMDARDFARNLMVTLTGEELPLDDEAFDEEMHDNLQYDQFSDVKGLIALFYRNLWAMADLRETLKAYEDKQEQGLLIELPVEEGTVWFIGKKCARCEEDDCYGCPYGRYGNQKDERFLYKMTVKQFRIRNNVIYFTDTDAVWDSTEIEFSVNEIGKTVFLTRSEAEEVLARMKEE